MLTTLLFCSLLQCGLPVGMAPPISASFYGTYAKYIPTLSVDKNIQDRKEAVSFVANTKGAYERVRSLVDSFESQIGQELAGTNLTFDTIKEALEALVLPSVNNEMSNEDISNRVVCTLNTLKLLLSNVLFSSAADRTETSESFTTVLEKNSDYEDNDYFKYQYVPSRLSMDELSCCISDCEKFMCQPASSAPLVKLENWFEGKPPPPPLLPPHYKKVTPKQSLTGLVVHQVEVYRIFQGSETSDAGSLTWHELTPRPGEQYILKLVQVYGNSEMVFVEHHIREEATTETKIVYTGALEWGMSYRKDNKIWVVGRTFSQPHPLNQNGTKIDTRAMVVIPSFVVNGSLKLRRRVLAYDFNWGYIEAMELKMASRDEITYLCSEWKKENQRK